MAIAISSLRNMPNVQTSFEILKEVVVYGGHVSSLLTNLQREINISQSFIGTNTGKTWTERFLWRYLKVICHKPSPLAISNQNICSPHTKGMNIVVS